MPILLELFSGTGSVGTTARRLGFQVFSLDIDSKYKPTINVDILNWDYKTINFIPDFIWASPPCETYSTLNHINPATKGDRDPVTAEPLTPRARLGTKILYRTLQIINYFKKVNPNLKYVIENPRAMMRLDKRMKKLPYMTETSYNNYKDIYHRYKPTNFWSNYKIDLLPVKKSDDIQPVKHMPIKARYAIPPLLIKSIFTQSNQIKP